MISNTQYYYTLASVHDMALTPESILLDGSKVNSYYFRVSPKTSLKVILDWSQRSIQNPVKHLRAFSQKVTSL